MLVVSTLLFLLPVYCMGLGNAEYLSQRPRFAKCLGDIISKYFREAKTLWYFNLGADDDVIIHRIHSLEIMSVHLKKLPDPFQAASDNFSTWRTMTSCLIVSRNEDEFAARVANISRENNWNPYVRFLVVLDTVRATNLKKVFNSLLSLHVNNVVVVNGTETTELYTYNPFENYACGKYYLRIIEWGKCADTKSINLYPEKIVTGLKNCFFNVSCPHWPPYSIDPKQSEDTPYAMGTEQYIFSLMSKIEQFKYVFTYNYDGELFSTVSDDMTVSGPLAMIQSNRTDIMLGGLMLIQSRARSFLYIHGHLDQWDEIRIMIKRASTIPAWKDFYLEFTPLVWFLLLIVLVVYSALLAILLRKEDKSLVLFLLLDNLLLHSMRIRSRQSVNILIIIWLWFAYLINCFYTSILVSLTTMPITEYQIKDEAELVAYRFKPCVSEFMQTFVKGELGFGSSYYIAANDESCGTLRSSIMTVSQSENRYALILFNIYLYYKHQYYDEYGNPPVYSIKKPCAKVVYAMYTYKGFPMGERLYKLALRIRETGLAERSLSNHYFRRAIKYHFKSRGLVTRFSIPWYVYIAGVTVSSLTFLVEVVSKVRSRKTNSVSRGN